MGLRPIGKSPVLRTLGNALARLGAVSPRIIEHHHHEETVLREAAPSGVAVGWGYRSKDVSSNGLANMRKQAHSAWINHPLAKKGMRTKRAFVCQEGFRVESLCEDPAKRELVQRHLDEHWEINWEGKVDRRVESLGVYGELAFWRPPVNTRNGHARIGSLQRDDIDEVLPKPLNAEEAGILRMTHPLTLIVGGQKKSQDLFSVVNYDWLDESWKGEVLYCGVNRLDTMMRGISDLAPVLDWLEVFDQLLYTEAERVKMMRSLLFHLKMTGASPEVLEAKRRELAKRPPPPGTFYVSNESEEIADFAPNLSTAPSLDLIKFIFGLASGCIDIPEHWYYSAGDVNRASAKEMTSPIYAGIRDRKREFASFLLVEHSIALQEAAKIPTSLVGGFTAEDLEIEVKSRDPERDALDVVGQHLLAFGQALLLGETQQWMSREQAAKQFIQACSSVGLDEIEYADNPESMLGQAQAQMERRRPQLEESNIYPLSLDPGGKRDWSIHSSAVR